ncbi:hypothetical protein Q1695_014774 [Nippostrongylus brasiliensis]|nr:hypothetical protein Q1695_014774 [Nippostrongylus brasiliensis]
MSSDDIEADTSKCTPGSSFSVSLKPEGARQPKPISCYPSGKKIGRPQGSFKRLDNGVGKKRNEQDAAGAANEVVDVETLTEKKCEWDDCQLVFSTQKALVYHVAECHTNISNRDWICKWKNCDRSEPFRAFYKLVTHVRKHTGEKPNECTYPGCNKSYSRQEHLDTHLRTHTGEKPYVCGIAGCGKLFTNANDRAKHQSRTHSALKSYKCPVDSCKKYYTDPSSLRKHIKTIHGDEAYETLKNNRPNTGEKRKKAIITRTMPSDDLRSSGLGSTTLSSSGITGPSTSSSNQSNSSIDNLLDGVSKASNFMDQKRLFQAALNHPDFRWEMLPSYNMPKLDTILKSEKPGKDKLLGTSASITGTFAKRAHLKLDSSKPQKKTSVVPSTTALLDSVLLSGNGFPNMELLDDDDDDVVDDPGPFLLGSNIAQGGVAVATRHSAHFLGRMPHEKYRMPMLDISDDETSVFLSDAALPVRDSVLDGFPEDVPASEEVLCEEGSLSSIESLVLSEVNHPDQGQLDLDIGYCTNTNAKVAQLCPLVPQHLEESFMTGERPSEVVQVDHFTDEFPLRERSLHRPGTVAFDPDDLPLDHTQFGATYGAERGYLDIPNDVEVALFDEQNVRLDGTIPGFYDDAHLYLVPRDEDFFECQNADCHVLSPFFSCSGGLVIILDGTQRVHSDHDFNKEISFIRDRLVPRLDLEQHQFSVAFMMSGVPNREAEVGKYVSTHQDACHELDDMEKLGEKQGFHQEYLVDTLKHYYGYYNWLNPIILFSKTDDEKEIAEAADFAQKHMRNPISIVALSGHASPWTRHFPPGSVFAVKIDDLEDHSGRLDYCLAERSCLIYNQCDAGGKTATTARKPTTKTTTTTTKKTTTTTRRTTTTTRTTTRKAATAAPVHTVRPITAAPATLPPNQIVPSTTPSPANKVEGRQCVCNYSTSWNDVMLVFEATSSTTQAGLQEMLAHVQSNLYRFNIQPTSSSDQLCTRIGIIVYGLTAHLYAPLGSLSTDELLRITTLPYYGDDVANLEDALRMAVLQFQTEMDRSNARNVIVLMATSFYTGGAFVPGQVADQFKADNGVLVVYNYVEQHGFPEARLKSIASPGYFLSSADDLLGNGISEALCSANCFCRLGYDAFRVDPLRSTPTAGCYSGKQTQTNNVLASNRCRAEGGYIANAKTYNQTNYLGTKFAVGSSFWIGLTWNQVYQLYEWADGSALSVFNQQWLSSGSHETGVDCVRVAPQGAEFVWIPADCRQSFAYSCEISPCDSETLCTQDI